MFKDSNHIIIFKIFTISFIICFYEFGSYISPSLFHSNLIFFLSQTESIPFLSKFNLWFLGLGPYITITILLNYYQWSTLNDSKDWFKKWKWVFILCFILIQSKLIFKQIYHFYPTLFLDSSFTLFTLWLLFGTCLLILMGEFLNYKGFYPGWLMIIWINLINQFQFIQWMDWIRFGIITFYYYFYEKGIVKWNGYHLITNEFIIEEKIKWNGNSILALISVLFIKPIWLNYILFLILGYLLKGLNWKNSIRTDSIKWFNINELKENWMNKSYLFYYISSMTFLWIICLNLNDLRLDSRLIHFYILIRISNWLIESINLNKK